MLKKIESFDEFQNLPIGTIILVHLDISTAWQRRRSDRSIMPGISIIAPPDIEIPTDTAMISKHGNKLLCQFIILSNRKVTKLTIDEEDFEWYADFYVCGGEVLVKIFTGLCRIFGCMVSALESVPKELVNKDTRKKTPYGGGPV